MTAKRTAIGKVKGQRKGPAAYPKKKPKPPRAPRAVAPGWVALATSDPPSEVRALLGEDPPTMSGGYGGWQELERPRRVALTHWPGTSPVRLTFGMVIDGFAVNANVEQFVRELEAMARPYHGGPPPLVRAGGSIPHREVLWVIESIDWGASVRNRRGKLVRQAATVALMQYVDAEPLSPAAHHRARHGARRRKRHRVAKGETLQAIAGKELGSAKRWKEIAQANGIRDPKRIKVGQVLRIP